MPGRRVLSSPGLSCQREIVALESIDFTYYHAQARLKEQAYYYGGGHYAAEKVKYRIPAANRGMDNTIAKRKPRRIAHV
jgi:hypothetical protein